MSRFRAACRGVTMSIVTVLPGFAPSIVFASPMVFPDAAANDLARLGWMSVHAFCTTSPIRRPLGYLNYRSVNDRLVSKSLVIDSFRAKCLPVSIPHLRGVKR